METPVVTHSAAIQRDLDTLADELGLTDRERRFCEYLATGQAASNADAARLSGFSVSRAKQEGWRLSQKKGVSTYLKACVHAKLQQLRVVAVQVLGDLLTDTEVDARVRKDVAFGILDRSEAKSRSQGQGQQVHVSINLGGEAKVIEHEEG